MSFWTKNLTAKPFSSWKIGYATEQCLFVNCPLMREEIGKYHVDCSEPALAGRPKVGLELGYDASGLGPGIIYRRLHGLIDA